MSRSILVASVLLSIALTAACGDDASEMQREANRAQAEADAKIAATAKDANEEVNEAQADANEKIDEVNAEADQDIREAQAEADKEIADARADFRTLREDYRHATATKLVELDKKVANLEARALEANGEKKAELETKLKNVRAQREVFIKDYQSLDDVNASTWDATKARLDQEWAELERRVDGI